MLGIVKTEWGADVHIVEEQSEANAICELGEYALSRHEVERMKAEHRKRGRREMEAVFAVKRILGGWVVR